MAFFKPMLEDKSLSMCQDVMPNTAEQKQMMYAICWMENGKSMAQVGIEPHRLIEDLKEKEISNIIEDMPCDGGVEIMVAQKGNGIIQGSSNKEYEGVILQGLGLSATGSKDI